MAKSTKVNKTAKNSNNNIIDMPFVKAEVKAIKKKSYKKSGGIDGTEKSLQEIIIFYKEMSVCMVLKGKMEGRKQCSQE